MWPYWYRLKVDWTYSTSASAASVLTAINATLVAQGRTEVATRVGNTVTVIIEPVPEAEAIALKNLLQNNWATGTRTAGKASLVMRDATST